MPVLAATPEQAKKKLNSGHDDSGYDGLCSVTKESALKEKFNADEVRKLFETCFSSRHEELWVTVVNYPMIVVVLASVVYLLMMGEEGNNPRLGGKRAAIQHYYNSVYGNEDRY